MTTSNSIVLLFGGQQTTGDNFSILLGSPIDKSDPNLVMDMSLGISFSYQPGQYSQIDVNGQRMTTSAGGNDDSTGGVNGCLLTVGGIGDSNANPPSATATPSSNTYDDELYDLLPFVNNGDTTILVNTLNPSNDDNIFFAAFNMTTPAVVGEGVLLTPTTSTQNTGNNATLSATAQDSGGNPIAGTTVTFTVTAGPNAGVTGTAATNAAGIATFSYISALPGADTVRASFVNASLQTINSNTAQVTWTGVASGVNITPTGGSNNVAEGGASDTFTVSLLSQPIADVVLTPAANSQLSGAAPLTFTSTNWNVAQTVTLTAIDDSLPEGPHTSVLAYTSTSTDANYRTLTASVTANIADNDQSLIITQTGGSTRVVEGGATDSYTIVLNAQPTADVSVALSGGTQLTPSSAVLTFTSATWNVPQTVTVTAVDDGLTEGAHVGALTNTTTSGDTGYDGKVATVTASISDPAGIVVSPGTVNVSEGGGTSSYTVALASQPSANVVVAISGGSQTTVSSSTLVFTSVNWNVPVTVVVSAVNDTVAEGSHAAIISQIVASADISYNGLTANVNAQIADNDNPSIILNQGFTLLEGVTKSQTAILSSQPAADVTVTFTTDGQVSVSPASITFTSLDWNVPRPLLVSAVDDGTVEGTHSGVFTPRTTSTDPLYNNLVLPGVTSNIIDNDGPPVFGTSGNDLISITFVAGKTTMTLNGKSTVLPSNLTVLNLLTGGGNDTVQVTTPTIPVTIDGGAGTDKVIVIGQTSANTFVVDQSSVTVNNVSVSVWDAENLTVNGRTGADNFTVSSLPNFAVDLKGDSGVDQITGPAQTTIWSITGTGLGKLNSAISINGIENWRGGAGNDSFVFAAGKTLGGSIDGGTGNNALDYSAYTGTVSVNLQSSLATGVKAFLNINKVIGGKSGADKLTGLDQANTWNLSAMNGGNVNGTAFANLENLTGGTLADTFTFADGAGLKGKIDGGGGTDVLDFSPTLAKPVTVNLQAKTASSIGGFLNIEQFQGGSGVADVLIGFNKAVTWNLTGPGSGDVGAVVFGNFENFTGGTLSDAFVLQTASADWLGTLNGGSGKDSLKTFTGGIWQGPSPGTGTLNGRRFTSIEVRL